MKRKYWVLLIVVICVIASDQWTKSLVQKEMPLYQRAEVVPGFFSITHVRNTGGAFGILGGERGGTGRILFVVASVVAVGVLLVIFYQMKENEKVLPFAFALVLAGAVGNLIDRLAYGEVVDFLDFYVSSFHWPAFNIADSAICVGIGLLAFELLFRDQKQLKRFK
jgi:signal peptidase II